MIGRLVVAGVRVALAPARGAVVAARQGVRIAVAGSVLAGLPLRAVVAVGRLGFTAGWRAGRLVGPRRIALVGAGVVVGLLVAPVPGRDLRERARRALADVRPPRPDALADRVRSAIGSDQRTWHLPQPEVEVTGRRVVLRGEVPHEAGRG
ncbi:MAG TPA: YtxH domain-containing protein, partial [Acidimicrobiales bacterium]